ncbi:MAG: elongation factor G [Exiguobacterium profundum]|nr:MAG: elongation factor G [Exiguobacterium profundum]
MTDHARGPRCAALVGAHASGKTTLFEELLFAGATDRRGSVREGNSVGDQAPEARARGISTELSVASFRYLDEPWTLIDTPGSVELGQDALGAMMVADVVVVVAEPMPDRAASVSGLLKFLDDRNIPHVIFINKMDQAKGAVRPTLEALQAFSARPLVLREIPIRDGDGHVTGFVDLVSERAWRWNPHKPSELVSLPEALKGDEAEARETMLEALADHDDHIMEELLEDVAPPTDEIYDSLARDLRADLVVPVFFGSAENGNGMQRLLKALRHEAPGPEDTAERLGIDTAAGPVAQVFRTLYYGQFGKLSLARIWVSEVKDGLVLGRDRVGSVNALFGRKPSARGTGNVYEVVALGRMASAATGEVLMADRVGTVDWPAAVAPVAAVAIRAEKQSDEVKLGTALGKLIEEDASLRLDQVAETGEMVLSGQGELHIQIALSRLKSEQGLTVVQSPPTVPYKETIARGAKVRSRHKKQSGGHGEFADVELEVAPLPRGEGFRFSDRITGGVVPKQYIPAVERGVAAWLEKGPLGFPVVDVAVTLTDGGFHTVDSSEMAFQKAAAKAMTEAMPDCAPVLLEPILKVTVTVPSEATSRAQRILSGRRGQLLGFDARAGWLGWDEVMALVPQAETQGLIGELRSQSLGLGSYTAEFDHLQEVQGRDAERVVQARAAER